MFLSIFGPVCVKFFYLNTKTMVLVAPLVTCKACRTDWLLLRWVSSVTAKYFLSSAAAFKQLSANACVCVLPLVFRICVAMPVMTRQLWLSERTFCWDRSRCREKISLVLCDSFFVNISWSAAAFQSHKITGQERNNCSDTIYFVFQHQ